MVRLAELTDSRPAGNVPFRGMVFRSEITVDRVIERLPSVYIARHRESRCCPRQRLHTLRTWWVVCDQSPACRTAVIDGPVMRGFAEVNLAMDFIGHDLLATGAVTRRGAVQRMNADESEGVADLAVTRSAQQFRGNSGATETARCEKSWSLGW